MRIILVIIFSFLSCIVYAGTGTTNYNLYKPDVSEIGWGELVNSNWDEIDTTLDELSQDVSELTIQVTIIEPDQLDASDLLPIWSNELQASFVIDEIKAWSDDDNVDFTLKEIDQDGANLTTIEAVTITTNGTNIFYTTVDGTDVDHTTIEDTHLIIFDADGTDTPDYIKITIKGDYEL